MPDLVPAAIRRPGCAACRSPRCRPGQLTLRPWRLSDAEAVVEAYRDPDIRHWHVQSMTEDEALAWLASWADRWRAETGAGWAVTQLDVVVGRVGFRSITLREGYAELAYWTVRAARGAISRRGRCGPCRPGCSSRWDCTGSSCALGR